MIKSGNNVVSAMQPHVVECKQENAVDKDEDIDWSETGADKYYRLELID